MQQMLKVQGSSPLSISAATHSVGMNMNTLSHVTDTTTFAVLTYRPQWHTGRCSEHFGHRVTRVGATYCTVSCIPATYLDGLLKLLLS